MVDEQFTIEDEWTDSAENEPDAEEEMWWARMLMEEGDEQC
jgi:hypothetical protein